jgi:hypothetical protein
MLKTDFSQAWHSGYEARLAGKHHQRDNPYRDPGSLLCEFFDWSDGYHTACEACDDEMERLIKHYPDFKEHIEFMTMRAYWQGVNSNEATNPYSTAEKPYKPWVDAWSKGRNDAQKI